MAALKRDSSVMQQESGRQWELLDFITENKSKSDLKKTQENASEINFSQEATIIAKKHELIAFHIYDPYERIFSPEGLFQLHDLETGEEGLIDTGDKAIQEHFQNQTKREFEAIKRLFQSSGADYLTMQTGESSSNFLQRFFRLRGRKK